jgi:hypothetical protein
VVVASVRGVSKRMALGHGLEVVVRRAAGMMKYGDY